jgi:hypothetical protein
MANETKQNKKAWMLSCEGVFQCFNPLILSYRSLFVPWSSILTDPEVLNPSTQLCKYVFCPSIQVLLYLLFKGKSNEIYLLKFSIKQLLLLTRFRLLCQRNAKLFEREISKNRFPAISDSWDQKFYLSPQVTTVFQKELHMHGYFFASLSLKGSSPNVLHAIKVTPRYTW